MADLQHILTQYYIALSYAVKEKDYKKAQQIVSAISKVIPTEETRGNAQ